MARAPLTEAEIAEIIELREERRWSATRIANKIGCSEGSVTWALLREGVDIYADRALKPVPSEPVVERRGDHVVRRFTTAEDKLLAELADQGLTVHAIARRMGRRNNSILGRMRTLARREARAELAATS